MGKRKAEVSTTREQRSPAKRRPGPRKDEGFRASTRRARVPRSATYAWYANPGPVSQGFLGRTVPGTDDFSLLLNGTTPTRAVLKDFQKYVARDPVRTVGDNYLWRGASAVDGRNVVATSTSARVSIGFQSYGGPQGKLYRVHVPDGTPVIPIPNFGSMNQHEILLPPGRVVPSGPARPREVEVNPGMFQTRDVVDAEYVASKTRRRGLPSFHPADSGATFEPSSGPGSWEGSGNPGITVTQQASSGSLGSTAGNQRRAVRRERGRGRGRGRRR